jgi:hypothetical protein
MDQVDELVQQAREAMAEGNMLVARGYWRRATRIAPDRLDIWLSLLEITDLPAERRRCLEHIVERDPDNVIAYNELEQMREAERGEAERADAAPDSESVVAVPQSTMQPRLAMRPDVTDEMRLRWDNQLASGETLHCINHPHVETSLRCNSCGAPICARCVVRTPVGSRCKACIKAQQAHFYTSYWYDYPLAALVSLVLSIPAAVVAGMAGWWFALIISPIAGGIIGSVVHWAIGRRRGQWTWLIVGLSMAMGTLVALVTMPRAFLSVVIYAAMAISAAVSVLRMGRPR